MSRSGSKASPWIAARLPVVASAAALSFSGCHAPASSVRLEGDSATKAAAAELYQALIRDPSRAPAACMDADSYYGDLETYPLVAAVRDVRVVKDLTPCGRVRRAHPGDDIFCGHLVSVRFGELSFLERAEGAAPGDSFRIEFSHDYWTPEKKEGVHLDDAQRYLIFARPGADNAVPRTDWDIGTACPF
jgi:hypothetical protein